MKIIKIGRSSENDIVISPREGDVSKVHALLKVESDGTIRISDLKSMNGTSVNGKRLQGAEEVVITPDDEVLLGSHYRLDVWSYLKGALPDRERGHQEVMGEIRKTVSIGRNASNTIVLPYADVSGEHAEILLYKNGEMLLKDKHSTNGTTVNGLAVTSKKIVRGDTIVIGDGHLLSWETHLFDNPVVPKKKSMLPAIAATVVLLLAVGFYFFKEKIMPVGVMEKYGNSVVIIYNDYVYEVDLGEDKKIYMTKTDKGFELYNPSQNEPITITGSGFFISADGKIMTNRHVALPWAYDDNTKAVKAFVDNEIVKEIARLEQDKSNALIGNLVGAQINVLPVITTLHDLNKVNVVVSGKSLYLGIGLNDTYINSKSDLIGCLYLRDSGDKKLDVAMIQVKNKSLPGKVKEYVHLDDAVTDKKLLKPGMKLMMIGYPAGFALGQTTDGLKVNFEEGSLSRIADDINFGHNLPTIPGSSGSPIFNEKGELVGVNNQQLVNTQTFNMAILAKHALDLNNSTK